MFILIKVSVKFVPSVPINSKSGLISRVASGQGKSMKNMYQGQWKVSEFCEKSVKYWMCLKVSEN